MLARKLALILEYDGTGYGGFQLQRNARTIQGEVEAALDRLLGSPVRIKGASRTDAGVHANGQVVAFPTGSALTPNTFTKALNYHLPSSIVVLSTHEVPVSFDPRRGALSRVYRYIILNRKEPSPLEMGRAYYFNRELDIVAMAEESHALVGNHDLAAFTSPALAGKKSTIRTVYRAEVVRVEDKVFFDIEAESFLPQQIRRTVGALLQVGLGKLGANDIHRMLEDRTPGAAGPVVPPWGLYLTKVKYPDGNPS